MRTSQERISGSKGILPTTYGAGAHNSLCLQILQRLSNLVK